MEKEFQGCEKLSTVIGSAYTVRKGGRDGTSPHCDPMPKPLAPYPPPCCQSRRGQTWNTLKKKKKQPEKVESNRKTDPLEGPDILRCVSYVTQCLSRIVQYLGILSFWVWCAIVTGCTPRQHCCLPGNSGHQHFNCKSQKGSTLCRYLAVIIAGSSL